MEIRAIHSTKAATTAWVEKEATFAQRNTASLSTVAACGRWWANASTRGGLRRRNSSMTARSRASTNLASTLKRPPSRRRHARRNRRHRGGAGLLGALGRGSSEAWRCPGRDARSPRYHRRPLVARIRARGQRPPSLARRMFLVDKIQRLVPRSERALIVAEGPSLTLNGRFPSAISSGLPACRFVA